MLDFSQWKQTSRMSLIGTSLSVLVSLLFIMSAIMKITMADQVIEGSRLSGLPEDLIRPIGILEILCVIVYLFPRTAVLGGIILTGYLGGAVFSHVRMHEAVYLHIFLGLVIWGGLFLREPALRDILPFRKRRP